MCTRLPLIVFLAALLLTLGPSRIVADDAGKSPKETQATGSESSSEPSGSAAKNKPKSKLETLIDGMKQVEGLLKLYHDDQKLYAVIKSGHLDKNFVVITSIARGISSGYVLGGMSWGFEDDVVWTFKKIGKDKIHLLRRNVRFKAKPGSPEANAVKLAYSDSVLYALPVLTQADGGDLVDLTRIFMSDDQQIGPAIGPGFRFVSDRSTWAKVKAFPKNVELQVAAVYAGMRGPETVSDPRGVQVNVHYSISELPSSGYTPRKADDRVGYFLTVVKDFSDEEDDQHFVRYINRWNLKKKAPKASLSPPEDPIIFYMEKTVPVPLRPYVQAGIEEWNKAFEKLGFSNAIQVRQQEDEDDRDPEDVRYNFFRWITAEAGFAMGPSRVNPMSGQILDADIIFDASFLRYWKTEYETFTPEVARELLLGQRQQDKLPAPFQNLPGSDVNRECEYHRGMQHQMGFAAAALLARGLTDDKGKLPDEFIHEALKEVVMHEVGHTLGLRHNFKASTWKSLKQIEDAQSGQEATVASVMDYSPANIAPGDAKQGPYYTPTIGPYDYWAIEYGYKADADDKELEKIASRGAEPGHDYATDEDTRSYIDSDPLTNRFDLSDNPVEFAERQMKLSSDLIPKILERSVKEGEGYQRARQAFGLLFSEYWRSAIFAARFPAGVLVHRDHKGDENARPPFKIVDAAQQRAAMKVLCEFAFGPLSYDPNVLNHLAATRWRHWGINQSYRLDYPIHEFVEMMQSIILDQITRPVTLTRLHDNELKLAGDQDAYTLAEHMQTLVDAIFSEWKVPESAAEYTNRKPYITSFRRNLQRISVKQLASLVTSSYSGPEDARTLARMHLTRLDEQIAAILAKQDLKLDDYSRAHLQDSQNRIRQVLNADLEIRSIN